MPGYAMLIHGMGVDEPDWFETKMSLLASQTTCTFSPLSYGDIVNALPLTTMSAANDERNLTTQDLEEAFDAGLAAGVAASLLGVDDTSSQLQASGDMKDRAKTALDLYKYVYRYTRRRKVHDAVLSAVYNQATACIKSGLLQQHSVILVGHSLGSVVAFDLLRTDIGSYFRTFISLGSPLGLLAAGPGASKRLPLNHRRILCEWVDVATLDDAVAAIRVDKRLGFEAKPFLSINLSSGYDDPHGAYFTKEEAVKAWVRYL